MRYIMRYKIFHFFFFMFSHIAANPEKGFCCVPVIDLIGKSVDYEQPYADKPGDNYCTRLSQLLFNEQVEIISKTHTKLKVKVEHIYYTTGIHKTKQMVYIVDKKSIMPFSDISKTDVAKVPATISFEKKQKDNQTIITLLLPFTNPETDLIYSAGTRFVKTALQKKKKIISVYCFNPETKLFEIIHIPHSVCLEKQPKTNPEKRKLFLTILRKWIPKNGYIPYVFGGFSIGNPLKTNIFHGKKIGSATAYQRSEANNQVVKYGIDCSQLIARAAQIAGIDYYYKNTSTLRQELTPVKHNEPIQNGDILVWSGHTCIVSDVKKGLLIEARGYDHGYGIVQEIPLSEQFQGITTFKELQKAVHNNKNITRLNKANKKVQTIRDLQIMKLPV